MDATGDSTVVSAGSTGDTLSTRAISSERIGEALDREVYGGFVELKSEEPAPGTPLEPAELPELDNGPHFFYGLQWWFFGVLAIFGFGYLAYDEWRKGTGRDRRSSTGSPRSSRAAAERPATNAQKQAVRAAYQRAYEAERRERDQSARSIPPSTGTMAPLMNDAAGESRKAAVRPNSSGSP